MWPWLALVTGTTSIVLSVARVHHNNRTLRRLRRIEERLS